MIKKVPEGDEKKGMTLRRFLLGLGLGAILLSRLSHATELEAQQRLSAAQKTLSEAESAQAKALAGAREKVLQAHASQISFYDTQSPSQRKAYMATLQKKIAAAQEQARQSSAAKVTEAEYKVKAAQDELESQVVVQKALGLPLTASEINREAPSAAGPDTQPPSAVEAPWYEQVLEKIEKMAGMSPEEKKNEAREITDMMQAEADAAALARAREADAQDQAREAEVEARKRFDLPPEPEAPAVSADEENDVATITVRKTARTSPIQRLTDFVMRQTGYTPTEELKKKLDDTVMPALLADIKVSPQNQKAIVNTLGEVKEVYRGDGAPVPITLLNAHTIATLTNGKMDARPPGSFKTPKFLDLDSIRLCEEHVYRNAKGRSLAAQCKAQGGDAKPALMRSFSRAYNKLNAQFSPERARVVRREFWAAFMACTAYKETGLAWSRGANAKPYRNQNPNDASTWTSRTGDEATNQLDPYQEQSSTERAREYNLGFTDARGDSGKSGDRAEGMNIKGGNLEPCIRQWNALYPKRAIPNRTYKMVNTNGKKSEAPGYDLEALRRELVAPDQEMNHMCGLQKVFSNLQMQKDQGVRDEDGQACVSPFNKFYNHFGSYMCASGGMLKCMAHFVDYTTDTIKADVLDGANLYYFTHLAAAEAGYKAHLSGAAPAGATPSPTPAPAKRK